MERITLITKPQKDYELLDSGREEKLERYGSVLLARPDPQPLWEKGLTENEWAKAAGRYIREGREGKWIEKELPKEWQIEFGGFNFFIRPTSFKHTGLFPEQLSNWQWLSAALASRSPSEDVGVHIQQAPPSVLNLFGYTGGATLAAAKAGAEVTHLDASKTAVTWARKNAEASGLADRPVRWIVEDAVLFVERELKRGKRYDAIIMDPPAFGHGPNDELWKIEEDFLKLMELCKKLLSDNPFFFIINGYAAGYSPLAFAYNLESLQKKFGGALEFGDLSIEEKNSGRLLPCGIFARWKK